MLEKVTYYVKTLLFLGVLIILSSCTEAYLKSDYKITNTTVESSVDDVCASFSDNFFNIKAQAQIYCAKQNKTPVFTTKKFFTDCSLTHPVVYTFNCI